MTTIRWKRLHDAAVFPKAAHAGDALDLSATEEIILQPNVPALVKTGWAIELPENYRAWVTPRSGLALKHGITVLNAPGLIDPAYRGEIGVILLWNGHDSTGWTCSKKRDEGDGDPWWPKHEMNGKTAVACPTCKPAYRIASGDRIAQLTTSRIEPTENIESEELTDTTRAADGFGSTGR
jgi:dUTP pyrophosphatase